MNYWINPSDNAMFAKCVKSEVAKHVMNCNDLHDESINMINDEPIGFIEDVYV